MNYTQPQLLGAAIAAAQILARIEASPELIVVIRIIDHQGNEYGSSSCAIT